MIVWILIGAMIMAAGLLSWVKWIRFSNQLKKDLEVEKKKYETEYQTKRQQLDDWRAREEVAINNRVSQQSRQSAGVQLKQWKLDEEARIREDAVLRSNAIIKGKYAENFLPLLASFPYSPRDTRFLGSPTDLVVFDGLSEGNVREILFIEAKTGKARLTERETQIRQAVQEKRVKWMEFRMDEDTK